LKTREDLSEGASGLIAARFRPTRLLHERSTVRTMLADDLETDATVVVKVSALPERDDALTQARLEHEASVLERISSPYVAPLIAIGRSDDGLYIVQPAVPGLSLEERLREGGLGLSESLTVAIDLVRALQAAHELGIVHRDVKPSNIIVTGSPIERATLVDFGLALMEELDGAARDVPGGTALYMAPEQAGLLEGGADERSDLYSAGAVLFQCLAGRPPFVATTLSEALRQHLTTKPPKLREIGVDVPRAVDELVQRLLAKDPRDRYQSTTGVLADLEEIAAALGRGETEPPVVVGVRDRRRTLAEPAFVGRDFELSALQAEFERARRGLGDVVLVEAESGGGKTRLLQEFSQRAALNGARVFRGQGTNEAAQRPFELLRGLAMNLLERSASEPELADYIRTRLGDAREAVCGALPELEDFLGARAEQLGPEEFGEGRTLDALEALITALGSPEHPALLVLDDCQWADEFTLKLLSRWNATDRGTKRFVLVAIAFRSEEVAAGHVLRSFENPIRLSLDPLRAADVRLLVESMAGVVPEEAIDVVVDLAEGSPFMAAAVLRGLVESGALVEGPDGWQAVSDALSEATASRRAGAMLARRLALLDASTLSFLQAGAVLGKEFDANLAATLAGVKPNIFVPALEDARRRHLIWVRDASCAFVHDKIRETVLDGLSPEDRRALHARAAERIETLDLDRVFEIAYHLDAAGAGNRALPFAIQAAELARSRYALAIAQRNYEIAERAAASVGDATRMRVAEGLGDIFMLRGLYDDAEPRFRFAATLAPDALTGARIAGKIGELAFKRGDVRAGTEALESALAVLGHGTPRTFLGSLLRTPLQIVVQVVHSVFPRISCGRRSVKKGEGDLLAVRIFDRLAYAYWFYRGPVPALWAHLRGLNIAERYEPTRELAKSWSTHVAAISLIVAVFPKRAQKYAQRALDLSRDCGDLWGEANAMHFLGLAYYTTGRFTESLAQTREAVRVFERSGDRWEANIAAYHSASSLAYLGRRSEALDEARRVHRAGVEIGDAQARGFGISVWSRASDGIVPEDVLRTELERETDDTLTASMVVLAEAIRLVATGRTTDASAAVRRGIRLVLRSQMLQVYVVGLFIWRATIMRLCVEATTIYGRPHARAIRRSWRWSVRIARLFAALYPNDRAHAFREIALYAAANGKLKRARRLFDRSLAAAERYEQAHEHAQTLAARGRIGAEVGWTDAEADIAAGAEALRAIDRTDIAEETVTVSLLDRFDSVLVEGRRVAAALSKDAVYGAVQDAAVSLLRPERCVVIEVSDDEVPELRPVVGSAGEFSATIARRAIEEGRPVVISEDDSLGDLSESLILAGVRSGLAAPIFVRGRVAACFYLEHRGVANLFASDEERIAGFIATVAGAALENAEGFTEIRDLTRTLERRVAERTAELGETNARLEDTLADFKRLDQLKTEFMAMAAHDLRTPLTVIAGFAGTLRENWDAFDDDQRKQFLYRINANTKRLSEFVENLLHFARIESGELSYDIRPFDLSSVVRRTAGEQTAAIGTSRFVVRVADGLPPVLGDEQRIWQVLTNLFSNAIKFSPDDAPVEVEVWNWDGAVAVSVRDHGPGIAEGDQDKLFQKFSRIERADGRKGPLGTGLGLYICRSVIEAQHGTLFMTGSPGDGAAFTFTLPAALPVTGGSSGERNEDDWPSATPGR
jgi:signal transduction histidine kinase/tetratricopeptide (TPR) repeat protein